MSTQLLHLLPELDLIKDQELKKKTIACWLDAMDSGGWSFDNLHEIPFTLLIPDCRVSFITHVLSVTQTAISAAKVLQQHYDQHYALSMDLIVAGGLLHDIGKLLEYKKEGEQFVKSKNGQLLRHPFSGANLAARHGLPDEIIHIIATHAKEGDGGYRSPESVIIHHADFMNFEPLKK
ncbi:HDIG domain-containing protein [candidate division KSB1 bacterium]|nr:HDIG domain-containing protein [candidate division KSB1 bacterium]